MSENLSYDLIIIGAGPAGCTAALYAARAGLKTLMISPVEIGGMMSWAKIVGNFPGQVEPTSGREILTKIHQQAINAGAEHILESVNGIDLSGEVKTVYAGITPHTAHAVIIATGAMAPSKKAAGEDEYQGRGVCYCAACDGPLYRGQKVLVIGQDEQAVEEALALSGVAENVCLAVPSAELGVAEALREALEQRDNVTVRCGMKLEEIVGEADGVTGATFKGPDGEQCNLEAQGVFMYLRGTAPVTDFLYGTLETDEKGFITTDELCQTSAAGVFAAGDVRSKQARQMVIACAEGAISALAAERMIRGRSTVRLDRGEAKTE